MERVKSSDVLDVTHTLSSAMTGQVVGYFRRLGPNSYDDYGFVAEPSESLELLPNVPVMLERRGPEVRVRSRGRVVRVRFVPTADDHAVLGDNPSPQALRAYFVERFLSGGGEDGPLGASALIAKKLGG